MQRKHKQRNIFIKAPYLNITPYFTNIITMFFKPVINCSNPPEIN